MEQHENPTVYGKVKIRPIMGLKWLHTARRTDEGIVKIRPIMGLKFIIHEFIHNI